MHAIRLRTGAGHWGSIDVALYAVGEAMDVSQRLFDLQPTGLRAARELSFSAPPDAILEPGATYAIYVRRKTGVCILDATQSNIEGKKVSSGWEIKDRYYVRQGARWVRSSSNASLRDSVEGTRFMTQPEGEVAYVH